MNNIGTISISLPRTIGNTLTVTDGNSINAISGFVDVGFIAFDNNGSMGVCTAFSRDSQDNPTYVFRTCSLDTDIDIQSVLSVGY